MEFHLISDYRFGLQHVACMVWTGTSEKQDESWKHGHECGTVCTTLYVCQYRALRTDGTRPLHGCPDARQRRALPRLGQVSMAAPQSPQGPLVLGSRPWAGPGPGAGEPHATPVGMRRDQALAARCPLPAARCPRQGCTHTHPGLIVNVSGLPQKVEINKTRSTKRTEGSASRRQPPNQHT